MFNKPRMWRLVAAVFAVALLGESGPTWAQVTSRPGATVATHTSVNGRVNGSTGISTSTSSSASLALRNLFADEWERGLRDAPEFATQQGDRRFDDRWTDLSLPAIQARQVADVAALARLRGIDRRLLKPAEQVDHDTFQWLLQKQVERQRFAEHLQPIGHQGGLATADNITQVMRFENAADFEPYLSRLAALPKLVDQTIELMKAGVKAGRVPPRVLMQRVAGQLAAQADASVLANPRSSAFYKPFLRLPDSLPTAQRQALQARAQSLIAEQVVPAYQALQRYFVNDYLPNTRAGIAASDGPDGRAYYDFLARDYTTTNLSVDEIHQTGLKEVARLRGLLETVKQEVGFKGSLSEFFVHLRTDPQFFYKTPAELLAGYQALSKRIDPELVKVFRVLPRLTYGVRAIPDNIAPDTTTAYYQQGAADGSRAGFFYVNLFKPESRPKWEMVPLSLHEAVPGHHFQFSIGLELPDAPLFRKTAYFVAYGEGWALYAEQLGYEMGLYGDPYDRFGQLTYEMWRALRLVVDTGMHAKGWTREEAIHYFKDNAAKSELDIVNEIDRYIGTPGQALAYKIGQMKISQLRDVAKTELGGKFDLRDFNDAVLATGSVPLATLEVRMRDWIKTQSLR
jgi:uncharacterized protein (DUF885 family)